MKTNLAIIAALAVAVACYLLPACSYIPPSTGTAPTAAPSPIVAYGVTEATAAIVKAEPKVAPYVTTVANVFAQLPAGAPPSVDALQAKADDYVQKFAAKEPALAFLVPTLDKIAAAAIKDYAKALPTLDKAVSAVDVGKAYAPAVEAGASR